MFLNDHYENMMGEKSRVAFQHMHENGVLHWASLHHSNHYENSDAVTSRYPYWDEVTCIIIYVGGGSCDVTDIAGYWRHGQSHS